MPNRRMWEDIFGSPLGISSEETAAGSGGDPKISIPLISQQSAPAQMEQPIMPAPKRSLEKLRSRREHLEKRRLEGNDSADDEDDELGTHRDRGYRAKQPPPSSKLGIEMMRANSHDSVAISSDSTSEPVTQVMTPAREADVSPLSGARPPAKASLQTTPEPSPTLDINISEEGSDETPRPATTTTQDDAVEEPTPRPIMKYSETVLRMNQP